MKLPSDNAVLLSLINMKLRDYNLTLDELCAEEDFDPKEILSRLERYGYAYDPQQNAFKPV